MSLSLTGSGTLTIFGVGAGASPLLIAYLGSVPAVEQPQSKAPTTIGNIRMQLLLLASLPY
jgi:hypothetical protein